MERSTRRRPAVLASVAPGDLGVGVTAPEAQTRYLPRTVDSALLDLLGSAAPLVVVTGPRLAGTTRSLAVAARHMLGDHLLVRPDDLSAVPLMDLVQRVVSPRHDVIVWIDDAPLGVLDQLTTELWDAIPDGVRVLVTTRAHLVDAASDRLREVAVSVRPVSRSEGGAPRGALLGEAMSPLVPVRERMTPAAGRASLEQLVVRAAADWDRVGVPIPLVPERLVGLLGSYAWAVGPRRARAAGRAVLRPSPGGVALISRTTRGISRTTRGEAAHLRAHPLVTHLADRPADPASWPVPDALVARLAVELDPDARRVVGRTMLGRGQVGAAVRLLRDLGPDGVAPAQALTAARELEQAVSGEAAWPWYEHAVRAGRRVVRQEARLACARLAVGWGRPSVAEEMLLEELGDPRTELELARIARTTDPERARRHYLVALDGPDEIARQVPLELAELELRHNDAVAARPWLERAVLDV